MGIDVIITNAEVEDKFPALPYKIYSAGGPRVALLGVIPLQDDEIFDKIFAQMKAAQAKSFMLREKDVQFRYSYQQPPGRLSVSKPPASIVSRDSSSENIQFHDEEEVNMGLADNEAQNPESPLRIQ